jgi:hypothetical protein
MEQLHGRVGYPAIAAYSRALPRAFAARRPAFSAPDLAVSLSLLAGLLATLFAGLKLAGLVGWPWLWVASPLWGLFAAVLALSVGFGAFALYRMAESRRLR